MKGRLVAFVGVFCIASLIASGVSAKGKPPKPDNPRDTEFIAFSGEGLPEEVDADLLGGQPVKGCCPNAGPFPAYTLTLPDGLGEDPVLIPAGTYDGHLFMNGYRSSPSDKNQQYMVQFWVLPEDAEFHFFIKIIGGVIDDDKKNKITTVTFVQEPCLGPNGGYIDTVSFTLVRTRL